ncbi:guanylate kinase [Schaalia cardiffensis]|uniref:guanylate kinase n=1 Tax=Schaalia cardiffensis TaxID=181487 RepID=UPI002AB2C7A6|nr:guanylate kinase [Schaalia cardiffensis]
MATPRLTVLAGPTAVGKGTVVQALRLRHPELVVSVSATTRAPRPGEIDGVHYHFLSDSQFDELVEDGGMLEWAKVHGLHRYGTPRRPVEEALTAGKSVLLEIDLDGARQVRRSMPEAHFVFLAPPSWDVLVARLLERGTEDEEERARRLETAKTELAAESEFDVTVTNDDLDVAVAELARVMGLE